MSHGQDGKGYTALVSAVMKGWPAVVSLLLTNGADGRIAAADGKTALVKDSTSR